MITAQYGCYDKETHRTYGRVTSAKYDKEISISGELSRKEFEYFAIAWADWKFEQYDND